MSREIDEYRGKKYTGRDARLFKEWERIDRRYENDQQVKYIIRNRNGMKLPVTYDIIFNIKSIVGVEQANEAGLQKPIFGKQHVMRITLPNNYPGADGLPDFTFTTDVWHPNIQYFGDFKGHVCLNQADSGVRTRLIDYIDRVINYLTYEDYHAVNEYPYPQDKTVAEWVLEQGEPQNWLHFEQD